MLTGQTKQGGASLSYEDLLPYQHRMIEHILENAFCALWVDMGLGKTVSTLTAIQQLKYEEFDINKTLVIAPLRVARKTWTDEIQAWSHLQGLTTSKILGTEKQRIAGIRQEADIHLINRENVEWLSLQFMEYRPKSKRWVKTADFPWDTVVIDESSSFRTHDSNRVKALRRIMSRWVDRMVQLTGTPAPNGLQNLWSQIYLLDRGERLGQSITAFRDRWMEPPGMDQHKWGMKPHAEPEIHARVADIALTLKASDYLDLPEVVHNPVRVDMSPKEYKQYKEFERAAVLTLDTGKKLTAANAGVVWGKLLQLANGSVYYQHPNWEAFHSQKLKALAELDDAVDGPMLVIYNYIPDKLRIEELAKKSPRAWRVLKTEQDEDDWNAGRIDRLVMHPASAGHGLNLHKNGAADIVWFGETADLELYDQANARLTGGHRAVGRVIRVHHIICDGTMDDVVWGARNDKASVQDRLMAATKVLLNE